VAQRAGALGREKKRAAGAAIARRTTEKEGKMGAVGERLDTKHGKGGNMATVTINGTAIQDMVGDALAFSAKKGALQNREHAQRAIAGGDCTVCAYFRYGLSKEMGEYLGAIDSSVQAVYSYEPEYAAGVLHIDSAGPGIDRGINLIVSVDRKNHALDSIVASLEDATKEAAQSMLCPKANGSCYAVDVRIVDGEELASRRGYGALVSSLYATPVKLWSRAT
jgi:hypothetical protein